MEMLQNGFCMIPNVVLYDKELNDKQKLLYGVISSLCAEKGYCWASNKFLGELLNVKEWTISNSIKALMDKGYIHSNINKDKGNERHLSLSCEISQGGIVKNHNRSCEKSQIINIIDKDNKINNQDSGTFIPKPENITPTVTSGELTFENIYNLFYHKSGHKPSIEKCRKVFDSLNLDKEGYEMLVKDLKLFRVEYKYGIKDQMYRPGFEKYVGGFNAEGVNEEYRLKTIIKFHMENKEDLEKMKKRYKDLCESFGKDTVDALVKEYGRNKNKITLNIN